MSLTVMLSGAAAVGLGAALGALLRWMLALWLNPLHEGVPPGTWVANVAGGYMVGLAVAWFAQQPDLAPQWRLFVITGFLGAGKTTLIRHLMQNPQGRRLAILVNEFGTVGVDGDILKSCADESCPVENIVELANGCICCTVADDFIPTIEALGKV
jgi:fluoride ion exporter CrcB/FEX